MKYVEISNFDHSHIRPECHVLSKAFSISMNTAADIFLLEFRVTRSPASYIKMSYCDLLETRINLPLVSFLPQFVFGFFLKLANTIPVLDRRLIEREFWGNLGSLSRFGRAMNFASFQGAGK
jgi:hypothetical protein